MKAMLLAAGRGDRMRPLTDTIPKPLLPINGEPLIVHHVLALAKAGIKELVVNVCHLADDIIACLGSGQDFGVSIAYSREEQILETGGGVLNALGILGAEPFMVISSDIYTDFDYATLQLPEQSLAHLVLTNNPPHHPQGDFFLQADHVSLSGEPKLTYGNIGIYHPDLFTGQAKRIFPLRDVLFPGIENNQVTGQHYQGIWFNLTTADQYQVLKEQLEMHATA